MAIFPNLTAEPIVQVSDRTRLDASRSFVTQDEAAITLVEIKPDSSSDFIAVTTDMFLDWEYSSEGTKTAQVRVTTDGEPLVATVEIEVLSASDDALFSTDADLLSHEPDVLNYLKAGRNSFKDMHRRAQSLILKWLDQKGYRDDSGARLTKAAIVDKEEVNLWSTYIALRLIFDGLSNATDDIFAQKAMSYGRLEAQARERAFLSLDTNGDGAANSSDQEIKFGVVKVRRQ